MANTIYNISEELEGIVILQRHSIHLWNTPVQMDTPPTQHDGITNVNNEKILCKKCSIFFHSKKTYTAHVRSHKEQKVWTCEVCGKDCHFKSVLERHLRSHNGEKPFFCSLCPLTFPRKDYLEHHLRKHKGEKPFICTLCEKKFSYKSNLQFHIKLHNGEKSLSCGKCEKTFGNTKYLNRHLKTHDEKISCPSYGEGIFYTAYNKHIENHNLKKLNKATMQGRNNGLPIATNKNGEEEFIVGF